MIAIRARSYLPAGNHYKTASEVIEMLQMGDSHAESSISKFFLQARQLAAIAVSENSETLLVVSALLFHPCQMLYTGSMLAGDWTIDSLLETGTYDWMSGNFGEEVAETIRLQPVAKRFLSTVVPKYFGLLSTNAQRSLIADGGLMNSSERMVFGKNRFHSNAMKLASWIDRGFDRCLEVPEMNFFLPFVEKMLLA